MRKIIVTLLLTIGSLTALAGDFSYLTFEMTDGEKVSVSVSSLAINISGTTLTAGSKSFTISNLSKLYFSTEDLTTDPNSISELTADEWLTGTFYDLQGHEVEREQMRKGVYIVELKNGTCKVVVR